MTSDNKQLVSMVVQFLQLVMLVVGVAGVFHAIGERNERLTVNTTDIARLRDISQDLLGTSIEVTTRNHEQDRRLDELKDRLLALETERD